MFFGSSILSLGSSILSFIIFSELAHHTFSVTLSISFSFVTLHLLSIILQLATSLRNSIIFKSELYVDFSIYLKSIPIRMRACMCLLLKLCPSVS